ncbi:MAG: alpha/beta hydrolase family protein [Rubripirellula sp.]
MLDAQEAVAKPAITKTTQWNGFKRIHFTCADRSAYLVIPDQPLPGNPWIWRARFPDFHSEMDIELVKVGYHVGYFDVANQFGSPAIIKKAAAFYQLMVKGYQLSPKPVMEGVSRGGLFVYNWAAANPDRVQCIYCDTPVCDFRSWPAGTGTGVGSKSAWKACLSAYGFTEEQALKYEQQPLNKAQLIVAAKIPVLHIVSANDRVVPPNENTYRLQEALRKHGGEMEIISVKEGTEKSNGHHFTHPEPQRVIDFIRRNTETK